MIKDFQGTSTDWPTLWNSLPLHDLETHPKLGAWCSPYFFHPPLLHHYSAVNQSRKFFIPVAGFQMSILITSILFCIFPPVDMKGSNSAYAKWRNIIVRKKRLGLEIQCATGRPLYRCHWLAGLSGQVTESGRSHSLEGLMYHNIWRNDLIYDK